MKTKKTTKETKKSVKSITITDKDIDYSSIQCQCIFADKEFKDYLDALTKTPDVTDEEKKEITIKKVDNPTESELDEGVFKTIGNGLDKLLSGTLKLTGKALKKIAVVGGKFAGKWGKKALIATGTLALAVGKKSAKGLAYAAEETGKYVSAKGKYLTATIGNKHNLATMTFKANKIAYAFFYNMTELRWMLNYDSANVFSQKSVPSKSEVDSFMKTKIAKKFIAECKTIIEPIITNDKLLPMMASDLVNQDAKTAVVFKTIYKNSQNIIYHMFEGDVKYLGESLLNITESTIDSLISVLDSLILIESTNEEKKEVKEILNDVKDEVKDIDKPEKVKAFMDKNQEKYNKTVEKLEKKDPKKASFLKKIWNYLAFAVKHGSKFILRHWVLIIKLLFIVGLCLAAYHFLGFLFDPLKKMFEQFAKNGKTIEVSNSKFTSNAAKAANTAAMMPMLGGGLR